MKVKCCDFDELEHLKHLIPRLSIIKFRVGSERGNEAPAHEIFSSTRKIDCKRRLLGKKTAPALI